MSNIESDAKLNSRENNGKHMTRPEDRASQETRIEALAKHYLLTLSGALKVNATADSAGNTISLLPVKAVPAPPAPAPAAAPIAAPLPPPARPPIRAPRPAPPPTIAPVRFPLPFRVCVKVAVSTGNWCPATVIEFNFSCSSAPPANRPSGFASTTAPSTFEPAGIATSPFTSTAFARLPPKLCPGWLTFEPTSSASRTVSTLPEGTVTVTGAGGAG